MSQPGTTSSTHSPINLDSSDQSEVLREYKDSGEIYSLVEAKPQTGRVSVDVGQLRVPHGAIWCHWHWRPKVVTTKG